MANPFSKIIEGLQKSLGGSSGDSIVGVDIGSSSIKIVQVKKKGGILVLETYGELALGPYANLEAGHMVSLETNIVARAFTDLMREARVTGKQFYFSSRSASSLVFVLDLPDVPDRDIATLIPNEVRKYIPVAVTDVALDWWIIPEREDIQVGEGKKPRREVLVAAVHNDTLSMYKDIVAQAHVISGGYEIEMFSIIRSVTKHDLTPTLIIDFGAAATRVSVIEYGIIRAFHTIQRGAHHITQGIATSLAIPFTQAENRKRTVGLQGTGSEHAISEIAQTTIDFLFSEIKGVIVAYERKYERPVGRIIFSGGGALLKGLPELAQDVFKVEVVMANPFKKVQAPRFLSDTLVSVGPTFSVSLGLSIKVGE